MSFLGWPVEERRLPSRQRRARRQLILRLLDIYQRAFPGVTYELLWDSPSINAQAWRLGTKRHVRVYGGLVRHPAMTRCGLALMLAHETGHHLGGLPRDPAMPWMTWQGQADFWAASVGMPAIWGPRARCMTFRGASEILALNQTFGGDEPDISPECRFKVFEAGARGLALPSCAQDAYTSIVRDYVA
jgi:hypothetical protein